MDRCADKKKCRIDYSIMIYGNNQSINVKFIFFIEIKLLLDMSHLTFARKPPLSGHNDFHIIDFIHVLILSPNY